MFSASIVVGSHPPRPWRPALAVLVGNALTWFDLAIYGFLAVTMAKVFFPTGNETASVLLALGTFGVTFFTRPLGAIVIGHVADRQGRKVGLALTAALTAAGSGMIAFAPTYESAGIAAPILVVLARLIQGFASGGEFGSATAFLAEQQPRRRGFFASWQFAAQAFAALLATAFGVLLNGLLTVEQFDTWGWRVPFIFGMAMGPLAYALRSALDESPAFRPAPLHRSPIRTALCDGKERLLLSLGLVVFGTVANYTLLFMPTYAVQEMGLSASEGFIAGLIGASIQIVLIPLAGILSDKGGRSWMAIAACAVSFGVTYPLFAGMTATRAFEWLVLFQVMFGVLTAFYGGSIAVLMADLFAPQVRTTGVAVSYSLGVAIFGGFGPFFNVWLIEISGSKLAPAWYLMLSAFISMIALIVARNTRYGDSRQAA